MVTVAVTMVTAAVTMVTAAVTMVTAAASLLFMLHFKVFIVFNNFKDNKQWTESFISSHKSKMIGWLPWLPTQYSKMIAWYQHNTLLSLIKLCIASSTK
jgi:uncharacterized secreted protein with C-terminal beta-propeller domain